ncbi:MAG: YciI family protein [Actinomycetes bacterium]
MRFLICVIDDTTHSATSDEMEKIDEFNELLRVNGHWIFACGIDSPSTARVIDNRGAVGLNAVGPLFDHTEYVSGLWIVEAENSDHAQQLALAGSQACNRKVELRPLLA